MSTYRAVAAVTQVLRDLLGGDVAHVGSDQFGITAMTPFDAPGATVSAPAQVNLYLYRTEINAAYRNRNLPHVRPLENAFPLLPLNLYYMVTGYGRSDSCLAELALGYAMSVLHDHPVLTVENFQRSGVASDLDQVENLRISPLSLDGEDVSKLWSTFSKPYSVSAFYEVSVVLIESAHPIRASLPVAYRGTGDAGPTVSVSAIPPYPTLASVSYQDGNPSAELGMTVTLRGHHLSGDRVHVVLRSTRIEDEVALSLVRGGATELEVRIPEDLDWWAAGPCAVSVLVGHADGTESQSSELPLVLAPRVDVKEGEVTLDSYGRFEITDSESYEEALTLHHLHIGCEPPVQQGQRVSVLLNSTEVPAEAVTTEEETFLRCQVAGIPAGNYHLRVRIDGVDSLLVRRLPDGSARIDPSACFTVKPFEP